MQTIYQNIINFKGSWIGNVNDIIMVQNNFNKCQYV